MSSTQVTPRRTALFQQHVDAGAKVVDFAGWEMPVEYSGIKKEHEAVRADAGIFDLSHMGEVWVSGPGAMDYLQRLFSNDLTKIEPGRAQYGTMCNEQGRVLDDMIIYRHADKFLVVCNASNRDKIVAWMTKHLPAQGVEMVDKSLETSLIAIQGPNAQTILQSHTDIDLEKIRYYAFDYGKVAGVSAMIARTGYTGEDGFEIYTEWAAAEPVWKALAGLPPIGLGARDTLRLESGYALYGHELNEETSPLDAGLGWVVKLDKDFIGRDTLKKEKDGGLKRTVVGLVMEGRTIPREGYPVFHQERQVGRVTSGTFSPIMKRGIALASVEIAVRAEGTELMVEIRGRHERAKVSRPPFVRGSVRRA